MAVTSTQKAVNFISLDGGQNRNFTISITNKTAMTVAITAGSVVGAFVILSAVNKLVKFVQENKIEKSKLENKQKDQSISEVEHIIIPNMPRLPEFCHASVVNGNTIYISGCIGLDGNDMKVVEGGIGKETIAALECIKKIMIHCTNGEDDKAELVKVNVYLKDNSKDRFYEMNDGYAKFFKTMSQSYPARITVGCGALALGAQVEMDAIAIIKK